MPRFIVTLVVCASCALGTTAAAQCLQPRIDRAFAVSVGDHDTPLELISAWPGPNGGLRLFARDKLRMVAYDSSGVLLESVAFGTGASSAPPASAFRQDATGTPMIDWHRSQPYTFDQWGRHLYLLQPSGALRTLPVSRIFARGSAEFAVPSYLVSDSAVLAVTAVTTTLAAYGDLQLPLIVARLDGEHLGTVPGPRLGHGAIVLEYGESHVSATAPDYARLFGASDLWAFAAATQRVTLIRRDGSAAGGRGVLEVFQYGLDGSLHARRVFELPVDSVNVVVRDSMRADIARKIRARFPLLAMSADSMLRALPKPDLQPPARGMHVGSDGSIWLDVRQPRHASARYLVLDPGGAPLGSVLLEPGQSLLTATRSQVWLFEKRGGLAQVMRARLTPASEAVRRECPTLTERAARVSHATRVRALH